LRDRKRGNLLAGVFRQTRKILGRRRNAAEKADERAMNTPLSTHFVRTRAVASSE